MEASLETNHTSGNANTNSKLSYKKRLLWPILYLTVLAMLWLATPISELAFPPYAAHTVPFRELKNGGHTYILTTLKDLHFTGYAQKLFGYTHGYYYYTFHEGSCILALLAPASCEEGAPDIEEATVHVRIIKNFSDYGTLAAGLADALDWTSQSIQNYMPNYLLSEPGFHKLASLLLLGFYFISGACALMNIVICVICILFPRLSPSHRISDK